MVTCVVVMCSRIIIICYLINTFSAYFSFNRTTGVVFIFFRVCTCSQYVYFFRAPYSRQSLIVCLLARLLVTLRAQGLPPIITIDPVTACDDLVSGSDEDGIKTFDLTAQTSDIQTKLGNTTAYRISYHLTEQDAQDNLNSITSYTTTAADNLTKEIVVRIQDNTTKCVQLGNRMQLVVHKLPEIKQDTFVREQCDTDYDGIVEDDLSLYNVHFSVNHQNETFTYYTDPSLSASSKISTPNAYKNVDS